MKPVRQYTQCVPQLIEAVMTERNVSAEAIAEALGVNVRTFVLMRSGIFRLPLIKAPALAQALGIGEREVMRAALHDLDPELLRVVERCFAPVSLSPSEIETINRYPVGNKVRDGSSEPVERDSIVAQVTE